MINVVNINEHLRLGLLDLEAFSEERQITVKRDLERAGTLFLLENLFPQEQVELNYTEHRKPFLKGRMEHLSISHSHDKLAIIINNKESTGIDVELIRDKVINIKEKFLCEAELNFAGNDVEVLTVLWAAKETLYKIYGLKNVEFATNIFIDSFSETQETLTARLTLDNLKKTYLLKKEKKENYILVYALHEI